MLLYLVIFCSGAAILALELLASRVMTPYFGVSLYIWTGILSITLIALALGYWAGGVLSRRAERRELVRLYALMPAAAALAVVAACLVYPYAFAPLAAWSLLLGAFAACVLLLFVPLVLTSAMNPLLVAIRASEPGGAAGDAGSGRVFFVSTVGSVVGVLVTAFALIPYLTNYSAVLLVALTLALLSLAMALHPASQLASRRGLVAVSVAGVAAAGLLMWRADAYTGRLGPFAYGGLTWRVEAALGSLFGTVKILRSEADASGRYTRIYFHDGITQNTVDSRGVSMSFYTYALEGLSRAYRPDMKHALALGLGAGIVPMRLAQRGASVDAVEINPAALEVARRYFGYDEHVVRTHLTDARTYVRSCPRRYDVVIVDLFQGDGTPEYLVTREFFRDVRSCLASGGIAVFNTFADLERPHSYAHFLVTLKSELPHVALFRPDWPNAVHVNSFVAASASPLPERHAVVFDHVPERHRETLFDMLAHPRPIDSALTAGGTVVTDAHNAAAHDLARTEVIYRRSVVESVPPQMLVN